MYTTRVCVSGAGGFIGFHLVKYLKELGYWVRAVDIKIPEFEATYADEFVQVDLRLPENAKTATYGMDEVYHLAADMGGIGFITSHLADVARNNTYIDLNMLEAARTNKVERFFYSSSACAYPLYYQDDVVATNLKEQDAWPADPEPGYGLEKLYAEQLCHYYMSDYGLETRVARFHNVFGPMGTWGGGREKAPAALCRKIAMASYGGEIEIWGDGAQTRSFLYIDDCVEGIYRIMRSGHPDPINLGSDRLVTITELAEIINRVSGKNVAFKYNIKAPQGVRGRNSDNTKLKGVTGWTPQITLEQGLRETYSWIESQVRQAQKLLLLE